LAEEATAAGADCVPIFWLATEDHDLAEVNHVALLSEQGLPEGLAVQSHGVADAPVGAVKFGPEIEPVVERAAAFLGESEAANWLRAAYCPGETLGSGFARLFARLFAQWGVILLDPADAGFHELAKPLFRAAIERAGELDEALLARGKALEAAGYHQQVKVTPASTLLFEVKDGSRTVVRRRGNGSHGGGAGTRGAHPFAKNAKEWGAPETDGGGFVVGESRSSAQEMLDRIEKAPEAFNPNVLLRPVVQDYLLPTLVYAGGAAEVAYFAQVAVVYEKLLGRVTPILPRFSATLLEPKAERLLTRYQLGLADVLQGPEKVREAIAARSLPAELQSRFSEAYASAEQSMASVRDSIGKLDSTLIRAADRARMRMWAQINRLHRQASRAELLRNEVISRHADALSHALFPHKSLQEREVAGVCFVGRYGIELLAKLYSQINSDCHDHQVIEVQ
jgi:uncharacterized protein YllA (UPF0747 family)